MILQSLAKQIPFAKSLNYLLKGLFEKQSKESGENG
jgi:hypothetical protein